MSYVKCNEKDIPSVVRFDVPERCKGQIVEYSYGGFGRYGHDKGDPYMRVRDQSDRTVEFYRWVDTPLTSPSRV